MIKMLKVHSKFSQDARFLTYESLSNSIHVLKNIRYKPFLAEFLVILMLNRNKIGPFKEVGLHLDHVFQNYCNIINQV